jgi:hypothetical protein
MRRFPVFLLIIPAGLAVVLFMLFLSFQLETIARVTGSWFFGNDPRRYELPLYLAAAAIPLLSGILMCLAVIFISRIEDRGYEREWKEARRRRAGALPRLMESVDSINGSIVTLGEISARIKDQARRLSLLNRDMIPGTPERDGEDACARADTVSVTTGDSKVSGIRIIRPAGFLKEDFPEPSPQGPFPLPGSRQKIWYFPNI